MRQKRYPVIDGNGRKTWSTTPASKREAMIAR